MPAYGHNRASGSDCELTSSGKNRIRGFAAVNRPDAGAFLPRSVELDDSKPKNDTIETGF